MKGQPDKANSAFSTRRMLWVSILCGSLAFLPVVWFGDAGKARAAFILVAITALIIMLRWELRKARWFQVLITALFIGQMSAVLTFRWSDHSYPGVTLLALGVAYLLVYYGVIKVFELLLNRRADRS